MTFEIVDEAGNVHGPFETKEKAISYAADRALGEQRDSDDLIGRGWYLQIVQPAV